MLRTSVANSFAALATALLWSSSGCDSGCPSGTLRKGDICQRVLSTQAEGGQGIPSGTEEAGTSGRDPKSATAGRPSNAGGRGGSGGALTEAGAAAQAAGSGTVDGMSAGVSGGLSAATVAGATGGVGPGNAGNSATATAGGSATPATPVCGNKMVESGETCDGDCPTEQTCASSDPCLKPMISGDAKACTAECKTTPITACAANDSCCPDGCNSVDDADCSPSCGNSTVEAGETCDPQSSCPTACDDRDPCTTDTKTGSSAQCNVKCSHMPVVAPKSGDGCCPDGANANNDNDCSAECGNGVMESGETCDPAATCPTSCDDGDPCTMDPVAGSASKCNAMCGPKVPVTARTTSDKCCPANATLKDDPDCPAPAGWTVVEPGTCSSVGALKLHSGATVDCGGSRCSCTAAPKNNCKGGIAGVQGEVWITATSCGSPVASSGIGNIELAGIVATPDSGGCESTGSGQGTVRFSGAQTYCPISAPRASSCLARSGEVSCPAGYNSRKVLYRSYTGGGCKCAGCGVATAGSCTEWRYSETGCGGMEQSAKPGQGLFMIDASMLRVWLADNPAKCSAPSAESLGDVKLSEPHTICCP